MSQTKGDHHTARLRRAGIFALVAGPLIIILGIGGASFLESANDGSVYSSTMGAYVFVTAVCLLGVIELIAGVTALIVASRATASARLDGITDLLRFTAVVMTFGFVVTLIVLGEALIALIVLLVMAITLFTTASVRKGLSAFQVPAAA